MPTAIVKLIGLGCIGLTSGIALVSVALGANLVAEFFRSLARSRRARPVPVEGIRRVDQTSAALADGAPSPATAPPPDETVDRYAKIRQLSMLDALSD